MPTSEPGPSSPQVSSEAGPGVRQVFGAAADGEPYGRTMLSSAADSHELLAMCWRAGARCAPHDHGDSAGTIHIIEGRFVERRFRFEGGALRVIATATHEAPALLHIEAYVIHDMVAPDGGLSIHRYETAIQGMRVWDVAEEETLVVRDECGAWIPSDPAQVVSRVPWSALP